MLTTSTSLQYSLYTSFGKTEFFEFQLQNPGDSEDFVEVCIDEGEQGYTFIESTEIVKERTQRCCRLYGMASIKG